MCCLVRSTSRNIQAIIIPTHCQFMIPPNLTCTSPFTRNFSRLGYCLVHSTAAPSVASTLRMTGRPGCTVANTASCAGTVGATAYLQW